MKTLAERIIEDISETVHAAMTSRSTTETQVNRTALRYFQKEARIYIIRAETLAEETRQEEERAAQEEEERRELDEKERRMQEERQARQEEEQRQREQERQEYEAVRALQRLESEQLAILSSPSGSRGRSSRPTEDINAMEGYLEHEENADNQGGSQTQSPGATQKRIKATPGWEEVMAMFTIRTRPLGAASECTKSSREDSVGSSSDGEHRFDPRRHKQGKNEGLKKWEGPKPQGEPSGVVFGKHWQPPEKIPSPVDTLMNQVSSPGQRALAEAQAEYARSTHGAFRARPSSGIDKHPTTTSRAENSIDLRSSPPQFEQRPTTQRLDKDPYCEQSLTAIEPLWLHRADNASQNTEAMGDHGQDDFVRKGDLEEMMRNMLEQALTAQAAATTQQHLERHQNELQERQREQQEREQQQQEAEAEARRRETEAAAAEEQRRIQMQVMTEERYRAAMEAERARRLAQVDSELQAWSTGLGRNYIPPVGPQPQMQNGGQQYQPEPRAEYVKAELVGYVDPIPAHMPWDGSPISPDRPNTYVSFKAWITHVKAVLAQKNTEAYKRAVLDPASLHCLRGTALEWWSALDENQQETLRNDFTMDTWVTAGSRLLKRNHAGRRAALERRRRPRETLVSYATAKLRMLKEAFPEDRDTRDVIKDIREGLSVQDQLAIREDMSAFPQIARLMEELQRMDEIKAEEFRSAARNMLGRSQPGYTKPAPTTQTRGQDNSRMSQRKARTPFVYDPSKVKMQVNPKNPSGPKTRTYEFQDGKVIWLERECKFCGARHFTFECSKRPPIARAAPMEVDEDHEYVDCYMSMSSGPAAGDTTVGEETHDTQSVWDTSEAWDESAYANILAEN